MNKAPAILLGILSLAFISYIVYEKYKPYEGYLFKPVLYRFEISDSVVLDKYRLITDSVHLNSFIASEKLMNFPKQPIDSTIKSYSLNDLARDYDVFLIDTIKLSQNVEWEIILKKSKHPFVDSDSLRLSYKAEMFYRCINNPICGASLYKIAEKKESDVPDFPWDYEMHSVFLKDSTLITFARSTMQSDIVLENEGPQEFGTYRITYYDSFNGCAFGWYKELITSIK